MSCRKIVLFSTRKIKQEGIFRLLNNQVESPSLQSFFFDEEKVALDRIKQEFVKKRGGGNNSGDEIRYNLWKNKLKTFKIPTNGIDLDDLSNAKYAISWVVNYLRRQTKKTEWGAFLKESVDLLSSLPEDFGCPSAFIQADWQNNDIKALAWDESGMTLSDRISLFFPSNNDIGDYGIYAVHQLSRSSIRTKWAEALKNAIMAIENEGIDSLRIILWLHEQDLIETNGDTFRVLESIQNSDLDLSLGVFSHADTVFQKVLHLQCDVDNMRELVYYSVDSLFSEKGSSAITKMKDCDENDFLSKKYSALTENY